MSIEHTLEELQALRRKAVKALGIDRPVSITRIVGARLELTTTDGQHYAFEIEAPAEEAEEAGEVAQVQDLKAWTVVELRKLAQKNEIPGYGRMRKAELIEAIEEARDA